MTEELKPCPHCGGKAELYGIEANNGIYYVECMECDVDSNFDTPAEAIAAWNRRAPKQETEEINMQDKDKWEVSRSNWWDYENMFERIRVVAEKSRIAACDDVDVEKYDELISELKKLERFAGEAADRLDDYEDDEDEYEDDYEDDCEDEEVTENAESKAD